MKKNISIFVAVLLLFVACSEKKQEQTNSVPSISIPQKIPAKMPDSIKNQIIRGVHPEAHQDEKWIADISILNPSDQNGDDILGDFDGDKAFQYNLKEFIKRENLDRNMVRVGKHSYSRVDADTFYNLRPIFLFTPGREIK